jgi:hypothetical protein
MAKTATHAAPKTIPRAMPLLVGMTAGVFAAFVVQVQLGAMHMSAGEAWNQIVSGAPLRFASASVLWAVAGTGFVAGASTAGLLVKYPPPWRNFRTVRWIIGALIVAGLAHFAHGAEAPHGVGPGTVIIADIAATCIAAIMALLGASFARPR